ncbi:MAG: tRNA (adenosine(37)-N6)-threonylcarbamoyltransferase complex transferase subunit TsaD [Clostridia bacterium]|nr:tRNA (adenosine(37)-N6)-threonylcarbamoyltransferase complex transferase subunit TsaD [Clostridia bacterium]
MKILAIESSCDETSAAVVEDGRRILSCKILSQIEMHKRFGGVVPEIASRAHVEAVVPLTEQALAEAGLSANEIDAVAVTYRPGLIGALLVGVNFAKSLAYTLKKPLIAVNHTRGHVASCYLANPELKPPFLALVISGGHTSLLHVKSYTEYETVGITRDDAAGEAFDKAARVMGLSYPGGAEMDRLACDGDEKSIPLPRAVVKDAPYDFSYSGLKTAVVNYLHKLDQNGTPYKKEDVAASFTRAVCDTVTDRLSHAIDDFNPPALVLAGGVSANSHIRRAVGELCDKKGCPLYLAPLSLCGDNAAMIGSQAYYEFLEGNISDIRLNAIAVSDKFVN